MARGTTHGGRRIRGLDAGERHSQRRRQLLEAALELFAAKGYANTSIEQICQTALVGTKAFYEHFGSKESCYLALLDQTAQEMAARMVAALDEAPDDEAEAASHLVATFAHAMVDDPRVARATFGQAGGISPAVEEHRRANRRWAAVYIESIWARYGLETRAGVNRHRVAIGVVGGLFDLVIDWLHDADARDGEAEPGIDSLIAGLSDFYGVVRSGLTRHARSRRSGRAQPAIRD